MGEAFVVVGLSFGDEGKGSLVDYLVREHKAVGVIRYNGGPQAGHNVVLPDGAAHTFAQFGSGAFAGAATHLSRFMAVAPIPFLREANALERLGLSHAADRVSVDPGALVVTPFHRALNRIRELARGEARHGSCGMGVGEAVSHAKRPELAQCGDLAGRVHRLTVGHLANVDLPDRLREIQLQLCAEAAEIIRGREQDWVDSPDLAVLTEAEPIENATRRFREFVAAVSVMADREAIRTFAESGPVIFEGAHGVLLDEWQGFHPYTTWSTNTLEHADTLLREARIQDTVTLGIFRAYMTRHGPGPLPTEDVGLTERLADPRNGYNTWQRGFRVGWPDLVLWEYARRAVGRLDGLVVSHWDQWVRSGRRQVCTSYGIDPTGTVDKLQHTWPRQDVQAQAKTTDLLMAVRPRYEPAIRYLDQIEIRLETPVILLSQGPTHRDKVHR